MDEIKYLGNNLDIIVTNQIGTYDIKEKYIYPVNYGYIIDNDRKIDVYILGIYNKLEKYTGKCIGIIKMINKDSKLIVSNNKFYTDEQIEALIDFKEKDNYLLIRSDLINNKLLEIVDSLNTSYKIEINKLKKILIKIIINNIKDKDLIEHLLDGFLNIPTVESERLYNFLCEYLDGIDKKSSKFYKLEYNNFWG